MGKIQSKISSEVEFKGGKKFFTPFVYLNHNSLDKSIYPRRGIKLDVEAGWVAHRIPGCAFMKTVLNYPAD